MFEKKKKRGERGYFIRIVWLILLIIYTGIGLAIGISYFFAASDPAPVYPAPPERVEIRVSGMVVDEQDKPVLARAIRVNIDVPAGTPGGGYEYKHNVGGSSSFAGSSYVPGGASTGCVWGYVEIDDAHYDFEFGLQHIEWGAVVDLRMIVTETGVKRVAVATPADIKPALAPAPMMQTECQPQ